MHKDFAKEYFKMQLREMELDGRYSVNRVSQFEVLVRVQAGSYLPVFRIKADNFDLEPPLIEFADPETGERLDDSKWPPDGGGVASGNSLYPGKLFCRPGNIAYHTHPSHLAQHFDGLRNRFTLKTFFDRLVRKIVDGTINMTNTGGVYNAN